MVVAVMIVLCWKSFAQSFVWRMDWVFLVAPRTMVAVPDLMIVLRCWKSLFDQNLALRMDWIFLVAPMTTMMTLAQHYYCCSH